MRGKIFDTNKLIKHWNQSRKRPLVEYDRKDVESWAKKLVGIYLTDCILTPVYLEFVGGVVNEHELALARSYLGVFRILDEGLIRAEDWARARQLAERVPPSQKPRGAIDCLISAIAIRLRCDILTNDVGLPRH